MVDDFTLKCLGLVVDISLIGRRLVGELDRMIESRGCRRMIVSDNGTEFTSNTNCNRWDAAAQFRPDNVIVTATVPSGLTMYVERLLPPIRQPAPGSA
jgi:hypothetical protein